MWDTVQSITAPFPFLSGNSNFLVVEKVLFTYFILSSSSVCIEPQYWCWVLSTQLKLVVPEVGMQLSLHLSESFLRVKTKQKNKAKKKKHWICEKDSTSLGDKRHLKHGTCWHLFPDSWKKSVSENEINKQKMTETRDKKLLWLQLHKVYSCFS